MFCIFCTIHQSFSRFGLMWMDNSIVLNILFQFQSSLLRIILSNFCLTNCEKLFWKSSNDSIQSFTQYAWFAGKMYLWPKCKFLKGTRIEFARICCKFCFKTFPVHCQILKCRLKSILLTFCKRNSLLSSYRTFFHMKLLKD